MNIKALKRIGKYGVLLFVMSSGLTGTQVKAEEETAGKAVMTLLRAFESDKDKSDTRTLNEFFTAIIAILEDPVKAIEFKKEYPSIDIRALIAAFKKAQTKTNGMLIGLILSPFSKYLPEDLQDAQKLLNAIKRRTARKR